jgi:hypothetical protein
MIVWYKGENDNSYGLRYGDEVDLKPQEKNYLYEDSEYFGIVLKNKRTSKTIKEIGDIEWLLENFTHWEDSIFKEYIPTKPIKYGFKAYCPNCDIVVTEDMEECENCSQVLDWE